MVSNGFQLSNHQLCAGNYVLFCALPIIIVKQCEKDDRGRWNIGYLATVKVTLRNGVSHEDCGSGDGINESKVKAHEKAIKSAVTDAMKRAARHFGERLGNGKALYDFC